MTFRATQYKLVGKDVIRGSSRTFDVGTTDAARVHPVVMSLLRAIHAPNPRGAGGVGCVAVKAVT